MIQTSPNFEVFAYTDGFQAYSEYYPTIEAAMTEYNALIAKYGNSHRASVCVYCPAQCKMYAVFRNF